MKKIIALILIALGFFLGYQVRGGEPLVVNGPEVATSTVSFIINPGAGYAEVIPNAELRSGDNLFESLSRATKGKGVELSYKDYGGSMGMFLTSIGSTSASGDKWWQYWVNGQYANVGVSTYKPQPKDVIEFRLTNQQTI
ncbi:MAG: DUF4430 domain-containing protein [Candidatus Taylorbacteria bacterium]|nr:DUF4430 domain-containing protein [Candidatus Taylorbacteria bacterium]